MVIFPLQIQTFTIITEAHLGLAKTDGVFSFANAIELFKLFLVNALKRELELWFHIVADAV
jgi:hypothetical protein